MKLKRKYDDNVLQMMPRLLVFATRVIINLGLERRRGNCRTSQTTRAIENTKPFVSIVSYQNQYMLPSSQFLQFDKICS